MLTSAILIPLATAAQEAPDSTKLRTNQMFGPSLVCLDERATREAGSARLMLTNDRHSEETRAVQAERLALTQFTTDTKRETDRAEADAARINRELDAEARTRANDAARNALQALRFSLHIAIQYRRDELDVALRTFQNTYDTALAVRRSAIQEAVSVRDQALSASENSWKHACHFSKTLAERNAASETLRKEIQTAVAIYHQSIEAALRDYTATMNEARALRTTAEQKARTTFQKNEKTARDIYRKAIVQ